MKVLKIILIIVIAYFLAPYVDLAAKLIGLELMLTPLLLAGVLLLIAWALE